MDDAAEDRLTVRQLLDRLPPRQARIIAQKFWGEMTDAEIATAEGVSIARIYQLRHTAMERLLRMATPDFPDRTYRPRFQRFRTYT